MPRPSLSLALLLSCLVCVSSTSRSLGRLPEQPQVSVAAQFVPEQTPIAARFTPTDSLASWTTTGAAATQQQQQQRADSSESSPSPGAAAVPGNKPLDEWDVLLLVLTAITLFIAAGGGIGGGAVFVVLNVFLGGFSAAQAVALSNITILGGSLANFLANSRRRHPTLERPLIDYDLMLVMEPTTMLGALLGGYMNKLLPVWLTSCLLAALLLLLTWKLLRRGTATFIAESRLKRQQAWQQQEQEQDKQQRRRALPASVTDTQEQPLTEPLLQDDEAAEGSFSDDTGRSGATCTGLVLAVPAAEAPCRSGPAWLAAGLRDQQQQQQQQQQMPEVAEAEALQSVVVPVPGHLRPLSIMSHEEALAQDQQQQQGSARASSSASARAAAAAAAAAGGDHTPPLIWSVPASATASFAAAAEAAERQGLLWGSSGQQQQHQQQRLRWGLSSCCPWLSPSAGSLAGILASEARQLPWQPLLTLLLLSAWVVASDTLKGQLRCGSLGYWLVAASIVPPALFVTLVVRHWLLAKTAVKAAAAEACVSYGGAAAAAAAAPAGAAHAAAGGSIHWTPQNSVVYPLLCSAAGVVAGLFGVGGGIIKGPLMLELGVCPEVSAATSATMIMFTAGSAAVVYWNFGGVIPGWAAALASVGFVMTLVGQLATVRLVRALGRRSLIVFMMGLLMVLASGAAGYQSVRLVRAALAGPGSMWVWGSVCS